MLVDSEKAYCQALVALKKRDYQTAVAKFAKASGDTGTFGSNEEFDLLYQTTQLLLAVKQELRLETETFEAVDKELMRDG